MTAGEADEGGEDVNRSNFVAIVAEDSTYLSPKVFIDQVQSTRQKEATQSRSQSLRSP